MGLVKGWGQVGHTQARPHSGGKNNNLNKKNGNFKG